MEGKVTGNNGFLLIIDAFSKMMTAVALPNARANTIVDAIWERWFSYYGLPKYMQSHQAKNVDGQEIRKMFEDLTN